MQADAVPKNTEAGLQELYNWAPCGHFGLDARPECNLLSNLKAGAVPNNAEAGLQNLYNWAPCGHFGLDARPHCNLLNNLQAGTDQNKANAAAGLQNLFFDGWSGAEEELFKIDPSLRK